jgi:hypothetical protein
VNGPNGITTYTQTINTGLLNPLGASCVSAIFPGINMYAGGTYTINGTISVAGVTNANLLNDSFFLIFLTLKADPFVSESLYTF